jgi:hypothetical protein
MKQGVFVISDRHHAEMWKTIRSNGFPIVSSWIDETDPIPSLEQTWARDIEEVVNAAVVIVIADSPGLGGPGYTLLGAAIATGAEVLVVDSAVKVGLSNLHPRIYAFLSLPSAIRWANFLIAENSEAWRTRGNQQRVVGAWAKRCFGSTSFESLPERSKRSLEEAIELAQACGVPLAEVEELVAYVYGRPVGEIPQEIAGLQLTLFALAESAGLSLDDLVGKEIKRVLELPVEHFKKRMQLKIEAGVAIGGEV